MTTLRDLLDLPRDAGKTAFVVKLTDGVAHPDALMGAYAVTPGIAHALDHALDLVRRAVTERTSAATYVHGSFGSGKSHFMGAVSLLLGDEPAAWAVPEIHPLRPKHAWVARTKLLRIHLHMTGADSLEAQLFRAFVDAMKAAHPDAPIPPLFADQELFDNAASLRASVGDETFFQRINGGLPADDGWGEVEDPNRWSAARFDAVRAGDDAEARGHLFDALVRSWLPAFATQSTRWIDADRGFAVMSRYAKTRGYDGIVVFFDELILWLTSLAGDRNRLNGEVQKLAKMVEAQDLRRPVPLVGFAARQRDIAEMVGHQFVGADAQLLTDTLKFWEGRFETIRLEDRNLPAIIQKRIVRPKNAPARALLDKGFQDLLRRLTPQEKNTLLGESGDESAMRDLHPFTPALVDTLVAMSTFLQRERTALKILTELLLEHLDDYQFGRVVPVGDLYDVLAGGEDPMDGQMRTRWQAAKRLYQSELLPVIQQKHDTARADRCPRMRESHRPEIGCSNCKEAGCRGDNRLLKTALLAALVKEVVVLRNLTVSRVVQLNHGTLREPIPGTAGQLAVARLRQYAGQVGKLRVGNEPDPTISLILDGVDVRPILEGARSFDTQGARKALLRGLLFRALGFERAEVPSVEYGVEWRGFHRKGIVSYGNVREMERGQFEVDPGYDFKVVVDFPFDDPDRTPQEDERRLVELKDRGLVATTAVWLPNFFSDRLLRDLGELVVLERVCAKENRGRHLEHLRPDERGAAEAELDSLRSQKENRVLAAIDMAYGLRTADAESLSPSRRVDRHFHAFVADSQLTIPSETQLGAALTRVVRGLLEARYPRHPRFSDESSISRKRLEESLKRVQEVAQSDGQRMPVDKADARSFEVGQVMAFLHVNESVATARYETVQAIDLRLRNKGIESPTVAQVRAAFDPEGLAGMTPELRDFQVLAFAAMEGRELFRDDAAVREIPALGKLPEDLTLVRPRLPESAAWAKALSLVGATLGIPREGLKNCSARSLRIFVERCAARRKVVSDAVAKVAAALPAWEDLGALPTSPRRETADSAARLMDALATPDGVALVDALAAFTARTSETAVAQHIAAAAATRGALENGIYPQALRAVAARDDEAACAIATELASVLAQDELHTPLAPKLTELAQRATRILAEVKPKDPPRAEGAGLQAGAHPGGLTGLGIEYELVAKGEAHTVADVERELARLREAIAKAGTNARVEVTWKVKAPRGGKS